MFGGEANVYMCLYIYRKGGRVAPAMLTADKRKGGEIINGGVGEECRENRGGSWGEGYMLS